MKSKLLLILLWLQCFLLIAQRQADAILVGNAPFSMVYESPYANSILSFDDTTFLGEDTSTPIVMSNFYSSASFADKEGNLLFASNGWRLVNSYGEVLSYKLWHDDIPWPGGSPDTTRVDLTRGPLFLPDPADSNRVYLFYGEYVTNYPMQTLGFARVDVRFCYALLDIPTQSLISKDHIILDQVTALSDMVALRHGNGRDWWIYKPTLQSNQYYRGLLSTAGLSEFELYTVPNMQGREQAFTMTHFTQDGSMMAHFSTYQAKYCQRLDVDRCTGNLSNPRETDLNPMFRPAEISNFFISGDGTKVYGHRLDYGDTTYISGTYQYDFELDSLTHLSEFASNLFLSPNFKEAYFLSAIFELDSSSYFLSSINYPNLLGLSCSVIQNHHSIVNAVVMLAAPNFANYRLGPLAGSACDTLGSVTLGAPVKSASDALSIFPNPSREVLHVRFQGLTQHPALLTVHNSMGQVLHRQALEQEYTALHTNTLNLPPGVYTVQVQSGRQAFTRKWVRVE